MPSMLEVLVDEFQHGWNPANITYAIVVGVGLLFTYAYYRFVLSGDT